MEKAKHSIRFEAEVGADGTVSFSKQASALQLKPGTKVTVNIFGGVLSERLSALNVTEWEIERIGNTQFEDRDHVMTFLASQGVLCKNKGFLRRFERITS
ncbi:MAG: hypothetical protein WCW40_01325 [Bacteroidota bacterium]